MNLKEKIAEFPDFPKKGIVFRDITPLLRDPDALSYTIDRFEQTFQQDDIDLVAGIESRGFPFACALSLRYHKGMLMIRKQGKLPGDTETSTYDIEYGSATMEIQKGVIEKGQRIIICDDLLATGGTAKAAADLIEKMGGIVAGFAFVVELTELRGIEKIKQYRAKSLVKY